MSQLLTQGKYELDEKSTLEFHESSKKDMVLIPQHDELDSRQLTKLRCGDNFSTKETATVAATSASYSTGLFLVAESMSVFGAHPLVVMAKIVCYALSGWTGGSALIQGLQTGFQLYIRRADVDGIHAYYMSQAQYDDLRARFSDDEWDRVLTELAERPYEPLGSQLNGLLVEYVDQSATYRREIADMEAKCVEIPHAKQRLSAEYVALEASLDRIERDTAGQIKSAFDAHDDSVIEAIRISANSVLGPVEITN